MRRHVASYLAVCLGFLLLAGGSAFAAPLHRTTLATTPDTPATHHAGSDCFAKPGTCGYPDPADGNVGVASCSALPSFKLSDLPSASYYYSGSGSAIDLYGNATIKGYNIVGWSFDLNGTTAVTFNGDCITTTNGSTPIFSTTANGHYTSGTTVENSTITASGCSPTAAKMFCSGSAVAANGVDAGTDALLDNDVIIGAVEPVGFDGGDTLEKSYVVVAWQAGGHGEDVYTNFGASDDAIKSSVLLNPWDATAEDFVANESGQCTSSGNSINNSLLAGGGFMIYACSGASSYPAGYSFTFTNNRLGRCDGHATFDSNPEEEGTYCAAGSDAGPDSANNDSAIADGLDSFGYWPYGGYYGLDSYTPCSLATWSGNVWDDTGAPVACS